MSSTHPSNHPPPHPPSDERTPLLPPTTTPSPSSPSPSTTHDDDDGNGPPRKPRSPSPTSIHQRNRRRRRRRLVLLSSLLLSALAAAVAASIVVLALLARSLEPTSTAQAQALVFRGPDSIRLLSSSSAAAAARGRETTAAAAADDSPGWEAIVELSGRLGLDADRLLSIGSASSASEVDSASVSGRAWWARARTGLGRWLVDQVGQVNVTLPSEVWVSILPSPSTDDEVELDRRVHKGGTRLVLVRPVERFRSFVLPLTTELADDRALSPSAALASALTVGSGGETHADAAAADDDWLSPLTLRFRVSLTTAPAELLELAKRAYADGRVELVVRSSDEDDDDDDGRRAGEVRGIGGWWGRFGQRLGEWEKLLALDLPALPPLANLSSQLTLHSYTLSHPPSRPRPPPPPAPTSSSPSSSSSSLVLTPSAPLPPPAAARPPNRPPPADLIVLANCSIPNPARLFPRLPNHLSLPALTYPGGVAWAAQVVVGDGAGGGGEGTDDDPFKPSSPPQQPVVGTMEVLPFALDLEADEVGFWIRGEVLPMSPAAAAAAAVAAGDARVEDEVDGDEGPPPPPPPLEAFLSAYLAGEPLPLHLTPFPAAAVADAAWPPWSLPAPDSSSSSSASSGGSLVRSLLLSLGPLTLPVPPPDPPLRPLRSLEIEGMKLSEGRDGRMRASGRVRAIVDVPGLKGSQGVDVEVGWVKPDIFIYNGPAPSPSNPTALKPPFAHLVCEPLPAETTVPDPVNEPNVLAVLAPFEDQLLDVVSERELREFVSKVILNGGALAGVQGSCDVSAHVDGLTPARGRGEGLVIRGVKVDGEVWVGRR